ncbi:MAG: mechanosensitive ion channel family protein [Candidatus Nanohaloarchaea archaeon]
MLFAGVVITRALLMPAVSWLTSRRGRDKVTVHTYSSLTGLTGLFLSFIVALQAAQFGNLVTVLGAITAALTVAIGFGMREQISNVVGGFFVYTDVPFVKGDYIRVNDYEGVVREISLRQTILDGPSSEKLVVPNSAVTLNPVRNFTKGRKTRIVLPVTVKPGDAGEVEELLEGRARENSSVLENPEPAVSYRRLEGDEAELELSCWISDAETPGGSGQRFYRK